MVAIVRFLRVIRMGFIRQQLREECDCISQDTKCTRTEDMESAQDDRLFSANDVINLIFKMAPRLIKKVYSYKDLTP